MTKKFEYKVIYNYDSTFEELLNEMGEDGWELIIFNTIQNSIIGAAIFKREIQKL